MASCTKRSDDVLLAALLTVRVVGALATSIGDCDEVFNYWEPTHHVVFGGGMQTWEYAPRFALRSYVYVLLHAAPASLFAAAARALGFGAQQKLVAFYGVRILLSLACAFCEHHFAGAVRAAWSVRCGRVTLALLLCSSGMYHAAPAMLPSTFVMLCTMLSAASWMRGAFAPAVAAGVVGVLCGWPYVGLMFVPLFIESLATRGVVRSALLGALPLALFGALELGVNTLAYGKPALPALNAVAYNVFGGEERSSELYGVESWTFYFRNAALHFNCAFALALLQPLVAALRLVGCASGAPLAEGGAAAVRRAAYASPFLLWFAFFTLQPHKEERFLAPAYPHLCLAAASALLSLSDVGAAISGAIAAQARSAAAASAARIATRDALVICAVAACAALSASRAYAVHVNYAAPMALYRELHATLLAAEPEAAARPRVCVGREWFRYPSNFFLPNGARLRFVDGGFDGQLPQPFVPRRDASLGATWESTAAPRDGFNDLNLGDASRFVALASCDYLVEIDLLGAAVGGADGAGAEEWTLTSAYPFLDAARSPTLSRALYIPGYSATRNVFTELRLYSRRATTRVLTKL